ncbi:acylphosphatase [Clostridium sp. AF32-12BH]|uniref:acylphosphatase n=1 Tax=Clostridium sp. AF32-12BH TaxID=2292006 RepID=UPI000E53073C|nr:acylphosphatase [Clostridium sp. AF32-12BH]RHP44007.1 acylphosphatase [Clostridium sp. AF32-12BH]
MADVRKRIIFRGQVQGVGFRYTAKYLAQSLGLTGWVRNEYDGTVLLEIQGSEYMINKLLVGLNHNQFITIDWMDTEQIPLEDESSFTVR